MTRFTRDMASQAHGGHWKGGCEKCGRKCDFGSGGFSVQDFSVVSIIFAMPASSVSPQLIHYGVNT